MNNANKTEGSSKIIFKHINIQPFSLKLYTSFYPKFFLLEHLIKHKLVAHINSKMGQDFFDNQSKTVGSIELIEEELAAIKRRNKYKSCDKTDLVNDANFGFWVEFFNKKVYRYFKGVPIKIFSGLPIHYKRKNIYSKLYRIKELRNRLYHHQDLLSIQNNPKIESIESLTQINEEIMIFLTALNPESLNFVNNSIFDELLGNF